MNILYSLVEHKEVIAYYLLHDFLETEIEIYYPGHWTPKGQLFSKDVLSFSIRHSEALIPIEFFQEVR